MSETKALQNRLAHTLAITSSKNTALGICDADIPTFPLKELKAIISLGERLLQDGEEF